MEFCKNIHNWIFIKWYYFVKVKLRTVQSFGAEFTFLILRIVPNTVITVRYREEWNFLSKISARAFKVYLLNIRHRFACFASVLFAHIDINFDKSLSCRFVGKIVGYRIKNSDTKHMWLLLRVIRGIKMLDPILNIHYWGHIGPLLPLMTWRDETNVLGPFIIYVTQVRKESSPIQARAKRKTPDTRKYWGIWHYRYVRRKGKLPTTKE